jgi:hypothetical protein
MPSVTLREIRKWYARAMRRRQVKIIISAPSAKIMTPHFSPDESRKIPWSGCPKCSIDLGAGVRTRPPYENCPYCGAPIIPIWWQRIPWVVLGFFLAFAAPASVGLSGWGVIFAGLLCWFPATVFAYILVFKVMPPKYVRSSQATTTLFRR